jgi:hypothetical protein
MINQVPSRSNFNVVSPSNFVRTYNYSGMTQGAMPQSKMQMSRNSGLAAASTFHLSKSAMRLRHNQTQSPHLRSTTDGRAEEQKFMRSLKGAEMLHQPTNTKNPYQTLFSTEPTRRLERNFKKKNMHMNYRSNFNVKIDE